MSPENDLYKILQVSADAEQDIVDSIYRALCKKYHPDINRGADAEQRMKEINAAYAVLGDEKRRREYNMRFSHRLPAESSADTPEKALSGYFKCLSEGRFDIAYDLLCSHDKNDMPRVNFIEWRRSVQEIFGIVSFSLRHDGTVDDLSLGSHRRTSAEKYTFSLIERNNLSGATARFSFVKYAIRENDAWRIYLGYNNLRQVASQFSPHPDTKSESEFIRQWGNFRRNNDIAMGMPNSAGFCERVKPEIYRYERYRRDFSIVLIAIKPSDHAVWQHFRDKAVYCAGEYLKKTLRSGDVAAYLGGGTFAVLLIETKQKNAQRIAARLSGRIESEIMDIFSIAIKCDILAKGYGGGRPEDYIKDF